MHKTTIINSDSYNMTLPIFICYYDHEYCLPSRFSEIEESIKGKAEVVLEDKGEVLARKIEVEDRVELSGGFG